MQEHSAASWGRKALLPHSSALQTCCLFPVNRLRLVMLDLPSYPHDEVCHYTSCQESVKEEGGAGEREGGERGRGGGGEMEDKTVTAFFSLVYTNGL